MPPGTATSSSAGLLERHRAEADADNSFALWVAAERGHAEACRLLMDRSLAGEQHYAKAEAADNWALRSNVST